MQFKWNYCQPQTCHATLPRSLRDIPKDGCEGDYLKPEVSISLLPLTIISRYYKQWPITWDQMITTGLIGPQPSEPYEKWLELNARSWERVWFLHLARAVTVSLNKWVAFYCITRPLKRQIPNQEQGRSLKVRTVQMSFTWPNVPSKINQVLRVLLAFQFDYRSRAAAMLKTDKTLGKKLVSHTFIKSSSELYNTIQIERHGIKYKVTSCFLT